MKTSRPRALVVEDDPSWQEILSEVLDDAGLEVDTAGSLEDGLAFISAASHRVAVVDLSLEAVDPHNEDGLLLLDAVRKRDPGCATILVTGFATVELAVSVLNEYKALSCLRKEAFQRSQLRELVRQALAAPPLPAGGPREKVRPGSITSENLDLHGRAGTALVVEDDAGWRSILAELLLDAGFQIRLCRGYGEALSYLRREKIELAVLDLSLASRDEAWQSPAAGEKLEGFRLLAAIREVGTPVVVVSGVNKPEEIDRAYSEHGVFAFLEKQSFDRGAFLQIITEARTAGRAAGELDVLTSREREVLELLAEGKTNREIAGVLVISENTVKRHLKSIFKKLGIHNRAGAVAKIASSE